MEEWILKVLTGNKRKRIYRRKDDKLSDRELLIHRLLNSALLNPHTGCWEWQKKLNPYGYGQIKIEKSLRGAHRISFELFKGEIRENMEVMHICDNPKCINPDHLCLGTHSDNMRDCYNKGRSNIQIVRFCGEKNGCAKLTIDNVIEIRRLLKLGYRQKRIATLFGVSQAAISKINLNKGWKYGNQSEICTGNH